MNKIYCFGESIVRFLPRDVDIPLRDVSGFRRHLAGGGAATAHAVASLGGSAALVGAVSRDAFGEYIRRTLRTAGVDISHTARVEGGDMPLVFTGGAAGAAEQKSYFRNPPHKELTVADMQKIHFNSGDILHVEAGFLLYPHIRQCAEVLIGKALEAGCLVSVDACCLPAGAGEGETLWDTLPEIFENGLVSASRESLSLMMNRDWEAARQTLLEAGMAVLLLGGPAGPVCYTREETITDGELRSTRHWADGKDVYLGGFLHALAKAAANPGPKTLFCDREQISEAMRFAAAAAALAATKRGGMLGFNTAEEVNAMLEGQKPGDPYAGMEVLKELAKLDYYRLEYHIMPECGWLNDPNGLVEYGGRYHAFFQHYPYAPEWGAMHWGHVVSDDLLHWEYLPIALAPDQPYEKGCFSGSAVDNGGELTLIYTAHDDSRTPKETQCIATSTDGIHFQKYAGNPVIKNPPAGMGDDFRDPKVSFVNGKWHMVVGCTRQGQGCVSMYASEDLRSWEYKGVICQSDGNQGDMWECPDLFSLGDTDVLLFSPMNMKNAKTLFITGKMDYTTYTFTQEKYYEVDSGFEFYAPQTFADSQGRRILIGWMEMWRGETPTHKNGWAGALTLPRELFIRDGYVCQRPVEETASLRKNVLYQGSLLLKDGNTGGLAGIGADCMEIGFHIDTTGCGGGQLILQLRGSKSFGEMTAVIYDLSTRVLTIDKTKSGQGRGEVTTVPLAGENSIVDFRMFIDKSSLEIFACGGRYAVSNRIYPDPASVYCDIRAKRCDLMVQDLEIYRL